MMTSQNTPLTKLRRLPQRLWRITLDNPIVYSELRSRMRLKRNRLLMSGSSAITAFIILLSAIASQDNSRGGLDVTYLQGAANVFFGLVIASQLVIATTIAPATAAASIAGERERQTYDLLRTTALSAGAIVWGKFLSALSFTLLLVLVQCPYLLIAYLMGGPTLPELTVHLSVIVTSTLAYTAFALFVSSRSRRTAAATTGSYILIALLTYILPLVTTFIISLSSLAVGGTIHIRGYTLDAETIVTAIIYLMVTLNAPASMIASQEVIQDGWLFNKTRINHMTILYPTPWVVTSLLNLLFCGFYLWRAKRNVQKQDI